MAEDLQQLKKIVFDDYQESSFMIFLEFFPNLNCFEENEFKGIRKKYDWRGSFQMKINAVSVLSDEVKIQYDKAIKAKEELEKNGFNSGLESTLLLIKFETMLNSVYSLCDNLAFIGQRLHPGLKRSFNDQRKKVEKYKTRHPEYSEYLDLIKSADWYDILHTMRSESTHYLPGFIFHSQNGLGILYQNMEHLDNSDQADKKIEVENIRDYTINLMVKINTFLEKYGNYNLKEFISDEHTTSHTCWIPNPVNKSFLSGGRVITFSEYLSKQPGKCFAMFACPYKEYCPASQKNEESNIS